MRTLSDFTNDPITALYARTGAFFAFSNKQFNEKRVEGVNYVNLGGGLIAPKENASELVQGMQTILEEGIKQDIAEHGIEKIIERELDNHECFYTGEIDDAVDALEDYEITRSQVQDVYRKLYDSRCE